LREADEELGIAASQVAVLGSRPASCGGWVYETVLATAVGSPTTRDRSESDGHRWVLAADVESLPLHPAFEAAWCHPDGVLRDFVRSTFTPRG
uniref:NUDIX hydrolase n=1 Tax=Nocardioides sp. TaxID=35761 RepID=UPI002B267B9B